MATEHTFVYDRSFQAATDLSSAQWYAVSSSAAGVVDVCVASSGAAAVVKRFVGVLQNNPTSGHAANVRILGLSKAQASSSGTIAYGAFVAASTAGTFMTATTGCYVAGIARSATTAGAGQLFELELTGPFHYQTAGATA